MQLHLYSLPAYQRLDLLELHTMWKAIPKTRVRWDSRMEETYEKVVQGPFVPLSLVRIDRLRLRRGSLSTSAGRTCSL